MGLQVIYCTSACGDDGSVLTFLTVGFSGVSSSCLDCAEQMLAAEGRRNRPLTRFGLMTREGAVKWQKGASDCSVHTHICINIYFCKLLLQPSALLSVVVMHFALDINKHILTVVMS